MKEDEPSIESGIEGRGAHSTSKTSCCPAIPLTGWIRGMAAVTALFLCFAWCSTARPSESAQLAVQRFIESPSYSWLIETDLEGGPTQEIPTIEGKFHFENGWIAESQEKKQAIQVAGLGEKRVANPGTGWAGMRELSGRNDAKVRARELVAMALPHEELILLGEVTKALTPAGDSCYTAAIDDETARSLLLSIASQRAPENMEKVLKRATGELRIWVEAERLVQFEIEIHAEFVMGLLKRSVRRTALTKLSNVEQTEVALSKEALTALQTRVEL